MLSIQMSLRGGCIIWVVLDVRYLWFRIYILYQFLFFGFPIVGGWNVYFVSIHEDESAEGGSTSYRDEKSHQNGHFGNGLEGGAAD